MTISLPVLVVYALGFLMTWRRAAYVFAYDLAVRGKPDGDDIAVGAFFGAFVSILWPLVVPGYLLWAHGKTGVVLKAPRAIRQREQIRTQQERIRTLERELGIK
jgi:hypothetical protein